MPIYQELVLILLDIRQQWKTHHASLHFVILRLVELRELSEAVRIEEVSTSELDSLLEDAEAVEEEGKVVYSVSLYKDELGTSGVSELVELTDVTGESEEDVSEGVTVGTGVSIVPESLVNDSDGVSEGKTKLLVPEVTDSVYETSSESVEDSLNEDDQYE
ncbi:uncharacterized protein J4E78_002431 [Alternaria triticimaculans]|uniref:uncharacterized protein n=1 Tax=Alternaria triticimaculans TaxID=297637 RepID=UPI0020C58CCC|nr:uncharacterized protein J4E78_002431 [Alternaria triticimaculans]KAI4668604.1 hypothetical protein J4E78_002431 [Alternaria triticimaculans]